MHFTRKIVPEATGSISGVLQGDGSPSWTQIFPCWKDPHILDGQAREYPSKMNLASPFLTGDTIRLIPRLIGFPISDKLPKELELLGQFSRWPGSEQPCENWLWESRAALLKSLHFFPHPSSRILHDQSLRIDKQIRAKMAVQTFVVVEPASGTARKAGIMLMDWSEGELRDGQKRHWYQRRKGIACSLPSTRPSAITPASSSRM